MKSILISINPKWCEKIASGEKTIEVRKTRPKLKTPFKVYIYCTMNGDWLQAVNGVVQKPNETVIDLTKDSVICELNGKVIGEFVCDEILDCRDVDMDDTCLTVKEWLKYTEGHRGIVYGWHISDLVIYDKPRELREFRTFDNDAVQKCEYRYQTYNDKVDYGYIKSGMYCSQKDNWCSKCKTKPITRPPQSWCYVEEVHNGTENRDSM